MHFSRVYILNKLEKVIVTHAENLVQFSLVFFVTHGKFGLQHGNNRHIKQTYPSVKQNKKTN